MELRKKNGGELYMADGGMFGGLKRAIGMGPPETLREKFAREDAALKAKMASSAPAPAPAPPPQKAITQYSSGSATERRMKEAGLKNGGELRTGQGGMVPGKGKGDKIAAKYEPGEFVVSNAMLAKSPGLRQELQALRKEVLAEQGMTPEQADAKAMRGPGLRAVNGYEDEEKQKRTAFPSQVPDQSIYRNLGKSNSFGDAAPVIPAEVAGMANRPLVQSATSGPIAAPRPASPPSSPSQPLDAQAAADRSAIGGVFGTIKSASEKAGAAIADIGTMPLRGVVGAYDTAVVRPMRAAGLNAAFLSPLVNPASNADGTSQTPFMDQIRTREGSATSSTPAASPTYSNEGRNSPAAPTTATTQPAAAPKPAETPTPAPTPPAKDGGIRRIDGGSSPLYTNMPDGGLEGNTNLMNRRPISAQNQGALDGIQARQDASDQAKLQQMQSSQGASQAAPVVQGANTGGFGLLDNNRLRERELRMAATSSQGGTEGGRAYRIRLAGANKALNDFQSTQNEAPGQAAKLAAEQRMGMRKLDIEEANNKSRLGLDVLRTQEDMATGALTREGARMTIDQARQLSSLQQQYLAAGNDPEKQKALAQQIAALSGRGKDGGNLKDNFLVVGGGQEWDERAGAMRNVPQSVVDLRTGQPVGGVSAGAPKAQPAPPEGAKLTGPDGKAYVVRNGVPVLEK